MILKDASSVFFGSNTAKKIYLGSKLVYSNITPAPPVVSEDNMVGSNSAESYEEGSISWGDFTLSAGCSVSKDGIEIQGEETYISASISGVSYPMTFEFKGRIDSECYRAQANGPGMIFGMGPIQNEWGSGLTCYATTDYGIIVDTNAAMQIVTNKMPTYAHIILVIDSLGNVTMYLNGISNSWTLSSCSSSTSNKIYIYNGEGVGRFIGAINIMRWWNTAISTSNIEELFASDDSNYTL